MSDPDQEREDEVLRRMLKTPPTPRKVKKGRNSVRPSSVTPPDDYKAD
jgi:hypothetical protein